MQVNEPPRNPGRFIAVRVSAAAAKRAGPGWSTGPPSMRTRKRTGAPRRFALSETLSSFRAQSVFEPEPLETNDRLGIVRHALLDVDTGVVRQTAAWRSSSPPERPEPAASTTRG